jgi:hypothetical protein
MAPLEGESKIKTERLSTLRFYSTQLVQVQTIAPDALVQVLFVRAWLEVAVHDCGGPACSEAVTVTFCDGVKPFSTTAGVVPMMPEAVPPKYAPLLSAAYCSS